MHKKDNKNLKIRPAEENDSALILDFIKKLAGYEKKPDEVTATQEDISEVLFKKKIAEAIIAELDDIPVGFAIFFYNFSTFKGKPGIYIEDLFVNSEHRGKGIGKVLFSYIADLAVKRSCGRVEWSVLHWNEPSINFYKRLGAQPKDEWIIYKLSDEALQRVSKIYQEDK